MGNDIDFSGVRQEPDHGKRARKALSPSVLRCPSAKYSYKSTEQESNYQGRSWISYGANHYLGSDNLWLSPSLPWNRPESLWAERSNKVASPSAQILTCDTVSYLNYNAAAQWCEGVNYYGMRFRHGTANGNFSFLDGHVDQTTSQVGRRIYERCSGYYGIHVIYNEWIWIPRAGAASCLLHY